MLLSACVDGGSRLTAGRDLQVVRGEDTGVVNAILTPPTILRYIITRDSSGRIIPIGEGGGEAVHPSVACAELSTFRCALAMTPYPNGNVRLENPSILIGIDTTHWVEQRGGRNPVVALPPAGWINNSDPDLNFDAGASRYFLTDRAASFDSNVVEAYGSRDAVGWEPQGRLLNGRSGAIVSPSFTLGHDGVPRMYSVSTRGCANVASDNAAAPNHLEVRFATDYVPGKRLEELHYGEPVAVQMTQPNFVPWHTEVRWVPEIGLYLGLMTDFALGDNCLADDLFLATSADGVNFTTYPHALMWRKNPWHQFQSVYRSTFVYDAQHDYLRIWLSVHTLASQWTLWYMTVDRTVLLERLEELRATEPWPMQAVRVQARPGGTPAAP